MELIEKFLDSEECAVVMDRRAARQQLEVSAAADQAACSLQRVITDFTQALQRKVGVLEEYAAAKVEECDVFPYQCEASNALYHCNSPISMSPDMIVQFEEKELRSRKLWISHLKLQSMYLDILHDKYTFLSVNNRDMAEVAEKCRNAIEAINELMATVVDPTLAKGRRDNWEWEDSDDEAQYMYTIRMGEQCNTDSD